MRPGHEQWRALRARLHEGNAAIAGAALFSGCIGIPAEGAIPVVLLVTLSLTVLWLSRAAVRAAKKIGSVRTASLLSFVAFAVLMGVLAQIGLLPQQDRSPLVLVGISLVAFLGFAERPLRIAASVPGELRGHAEFLLAVGYRKGTVLRLLLASPPIGRRVVLLFSALTGLILLRVFAYPQGFDAQPAQRMLTAALVTVTAFTTSRILLEFLLASSLFLDGRLPEAGGSHQAPHFAVGESPVPLGPPSTVLQERPEASASEGFAALFRPDGGTDDRP